MRRREQPYQEKDQPSNTNGIEDSDGNNDMDAKIAMKRVKMRSKVVSVAECEALFRFTKVDKR